ncbi:hypothetical protein BHM03_00026743 [Ensete ventricosum]|nr:hypothetical protein BHM03_00026743 [Ensete ventricosum]
MYTAVAEEGSNGMEREMATVVFNLLLAAIKIVGSERFSNKHPSSLSNMRPLVTLAHNKEGLFPSLERSTEIDKDQHSLANPTPELVTSELKQYDGSDFDYSTTTAENSWEPRDVLQLERKIEDSAKDEEIQRLQ